MDGINKIGEFRGIPVYKDKYMSEEELRVSSGPKYPDSYYSGPAIYVDGKLVKPDGTPVEKVPVEKRGYEAKFIITGASMRYIEKNSDKIWERMRKKYGE